MVTAKQTISESNVVDFISHYGERKKS